MAADVDGARFPSQRPHSAAHSQSARLGLTLRFSIQATSLPVDAARLAGRPQIGHTATHPPTPGGIMLPSERSESARQRTGNGRAPHVSTGQPLPRPQTVPTASAGEAFADAVGKLRPHLFSSCFFWTWPLKLAPRRASPLPLARGLRARPDASRWRSPPLLPKLTASSRRRRARELVSEARPTPRHRVAYSKGYIGIRLGIRLLQASGPAGVIRAMDID